MQLKLLDIKYPLSIDVSGGEHPCFTVTAPIMYPSPSVRGKALVSFTFDLPTFAMWPMSVGSVRCGVEVPYGRIE